LIIENTNIFIAKNIIMGAYFLNISEEEKKSIQEKQRSLYDGYKTMAPKVEGETPLKVEDLALDKGGVTVNNQNEVSEYKNTGINKKMEEDAPVCEQCGSTLAEGKMCECGPMKYSMEELEESIKVKGKKNQVKEQINESLNWFKRFNNYL
jgi:hypothetical protein